MARVDDRKFVFKDTIYEVVLMRRQCPNSFINASNESRSRRNQRMKSSWIWLNIHVSGYEGCAWWPQRALKLASSLT
jgi:hypothetical protein